MAPPTSTWTNEWCATLSCSRLVYTALVCLVWLFPSTYSQSFKISDVLHNRFGSFNFDETENYLYNIDISTEPIVSSLKNTHRPLDNGDDNDVKPLPDAENKVKGNLQSIDMVLVSKHGQKYSCTVPDLQVVDSPSSATEELAALPNVSNMLKPMKSRPCLVKNIGWWTYEYCHGKFIRQYHLEAGQLVDKTLYLGYYANETVWNRKTVNQIQGVIDSMKDNLAHNRYPVAYHSVLYLNGTECDLINKPRKALVKIMCSVSGKDRISDIMEIDTCNYVVYVQTSLLCTLPLFSKKHRGKKQVIGCSPLLSEEDYQSYVKIQEEMKERKLSSDLDKLIGNRDKIETEASHSPPEDAGSGGPLEYLLKLVMDLEESNDDDVDERTVLLDGLVRMIQPELSTGDRRTLVDILRKKSRYLDLGQLRKFITEELQGTTDIASDDGFDEEEQTLLKELDDKSLAELGEEITAEVKEMLSNMGLPSEGVKVKLKVLDISEEELDEDKLEKVDDSDHKKPEVKDDVSTKERIDLESGSVLDSDKKKNRNLQ